MAGQGAGAASPSDVGLGRHVGGVPGRRPAPRRAPVPDPRAPATLRLGPDCRHPLGRAGYAEARPRTRRPWSLTCCTPPERPWRWTGRPRRTAFRLLQADAGARQPEPLGDRFEACRRHAGRRLYPGRRSASPCSELPGCSVILAGAATGGEQLGTPLLGSRYCWLDTGCVRGTGLARYRSRSWGLGERSPILGESAPATAFAPAKSRFCSLRLRRPVSTSCRPVRPPPVSRSVAFLARLKPPIVHGYALSVFPERSTAFPSSCPQGAVRTVGSGRPKAAKSLLTSV